jgi:hypothetical protein
MASDFIRWQKGLVRKPEVAQIARATGLDAFSVAARCMVIWEWADEVTTTGVVDGANREQIDLLAMHTGFCAALEACRPHGWIMVDEDGVSFPNYDRHNGRCAKKRVEDNNRLRRWREQQRVKRVSQCVS